ncbi:hypothetical protein [Croceivirga sp. JEA036]|uniref:hypothetical protein n=1 Tax=Croceivirga sp. JEA036 TaxID=2721162 RepID=UPI00143C994F|nr:hypothetical protein [Croceivirga sp. JEA036]NJB35284.1 hypothetical protein [Croceivirga sp. JEA036]
MQQEKDFIQREIQRLTLLIAKLLERALAMPITETEQETKAIEATLKAEFGFTLKEILVLEDAIFLNRIKEINHEHLEKLAELISVIVQKELKDFDQSLAVKGLALLDYVDSVTQTFSFKRMELLKTLQQSTTASN